MDLFDKLLSSLSIPPLPIKKGRFVVDENIGTALLTSLSFKKSGGQYLLITSNLYTAQRLYNLLSAFVGNENVLLFPSDELIRAETLAQSREMIAQRLYVLHQLTLGKGRIVVANVAAVDRFLPSPELFSKQCIELEVGKHYDINEIKKTLILNGYLRVNKVDQSLQYASRGDILDIFSVNLDNPIRIEFFDDEIESIRYFDIAPQTSIEKVNKVTILPATDILLSEEEIKTAPEKIHSILEKDQKHLSLTDFETLRDNTDNDIMDILEHQLSPKIYKYYSLMSNQRYSIFDYCPSFTRVIVDEDAIKQSNDLLIKDAMSYLMELHENNRFISHLEMYQDLNRLLSFDDRYNVITSPFNKSSKDIALNIKHIPYQANKTQDALNIIQNYLNSGYQVILSLKSKEQTLFVEEMLSSTNKKHEAVDGLELPKKTNIAITTFNIPIGFVLEDLKIVYLTGNELFNEKVRVTRYDSRFKEATILKTYEELEPGDYVVHEYLGIGQFLQLQTLEVDGQHKDFLKIAYFGGEILYVPLAQFQLVRKYLGKEGMTPRLSHLHSKDWENTKRKIKERINDLAQRLMQLYVERSNTPGYAFPKDDEFQKQFEDDFPYPLTKDQIKAIDEIKKDMESPHPMDRLLCGDVGFGKTEVAFQAAFKAINAGKQVAILCPTTLLCRQHYELALERFSPFDIKIAAFSRLIDEKTQKKFIEEVASGKTHLVIGTHRLLSKDISFKDLGLLIIDEEQRFGVEQKERIKELKNNVDVLTLSATPIPRTLQISLLGVRSLSKIDTPPNDRMPIQTYVAPFKFEVVKELIERELGRSGQVFYLHNNVSTIYQRASKLQKVLPEARIAVVHGKMKKDDIEDVMEKFYKGDVDVLVCTSIIENGIDVPNANMIIVEDSENYGLSQLYQIKGRVGRSDHVAYAYLFFTESRVTKESTRKRLKAIQEFTELGSGYKIAQRDLMIRGAGDILGPEQAGFIDSVGLDMYIKLLNEAVKEKLTGVENDEPMAEAGTTLSLESYIPESFASDNDKIGLYQEIMSAVDPDVLLNIKKKTRDIYGKLPMEVEMLFVKRNIDLLKGDANVDTINEHKNDVELILNKSLLNIKGIGNILFEAMIPYLSIVKISYVNNVFKIVISKRKNWISDIENILKSLVNINKTNKIEVV